MKEEELVKKKNKRERNLYKQGGGNKFWRKKFLRRQSSYVTFASCSAFTLKMYGKICLLIHSSDVYSL